MVIRGSAVGAKIMDGGCGQKIVVKRIRNSISDEAKRPKAATSICTYSLLTS